MEHSEAIVIGCGVIGLTSAIVLQSLNLKVTIQSKALPPHTTSNVAAAFWYPYKAYPPDKVSRWAQASLRHYLQEVDLADTGIKIRKLVLLGEAIAEHEWWLPANAQVDRLEENLPKEYAHALAIEVPVIESSVYLNYLMARFLNAGGTIKQIPDGIKQLEELHGQADIIVNCTGLGAGDLCQDQQVHPIRGQIIRTSLPAAVDTCLVDNYGPLAVSYIVPRATDCILGGTSQENDWNLNVDENTAEIIWQRCTHIAPALQEARIIEHLVGLRPGRKQVRLEAEPFGADCLLIHNYGHGGAGFTLAWGCAEEVAELVKDALSNKQR